MPGLIFSVVVILLLTCPGANAGGRQRVQPRAPERLPYEPEMVEIPGGSFRMGCVSGKDCVDWEHPVHEVRVEAFELSGYEVTFEEYDRFTEATGRVRAEDEGWGRGRRPVINVSWADAVAYTRWLSAETGRRYRLPSEAEWEYAARAGTATAYSWGNGIGRNRANCRGCGSRWDDRQTAPVGSFGPNGWGLHDVHGNVWEWTTGLLERELPGSPSGRNGVGTRGLFPARHARRLPGQRPRVPALRVPPRVHHRRDLRYRHPGGPDHFALNPLDLVRRTHDFASVPLTSYGSMSTLIQAATAGNRRGTAVFRSRRSLHHGPDADRRSSDVSSRLESS